MGRAVVFKSFRKTVTSAGTAEPLSASQIYTDYVRIRAIPGNTNPVFWGDVDVDNQADPLDSDEFVELKIQEISKTGQQIDLSKVYVDATTSAEGVIVTYQSYED